MIKVIPNMIQLLRFRYLLIDEELPILSFDWNAVVESKYREALDAHGLLSRVMQDKHT